MRQCLIEVENEVERGCRGNGALEQLRLPTGVDQPPPEPVNGATMTLLTKSIATAVLAAALATTGAVGASATGIGALAGLKNAAPQSQIVQVRGRGGRNIGLGILGIAAATAILAGAARAERRRDYGYDYDYGRGDRCGYLDYKCSQGYGWACRKFDYRCGGY